MYNGNEITSRQCRFLNEDYFQKLYEAFIAAFSDYVIPFALTETQFRNHINLNAVDLKRSVGCLEGDDLIGFSLNGFGEWKSKQTVYDAGTGVLPAFRRQGISELMFKTMVPKFKSEGLEQWLLEVISTNAAAIKLYEKLGFCSVRELVLLQCDSKIIESAVRPSNIAIQHIDVPDWELLTTFWDGNTSWQNSIDAIARSRRNKRILGAYSDGLCVGYIIFSSKFGRVAQLAVHKDRRGRGIGKELVLKMQAETEEGFPAQIINLDKSIDGVMKFFHKLGFYETLGQYEMSMQM